MGLGQKVSGLEDVTQEVFPDQDSGQQRDFLRIQQLERSLKYHDQFTTSPGLTYDAYNKIMADKSLSSFGDDKSAYYAHRLKVLEDLHKSNAFKMPQAFDPTAVMDDAYI
jgi:hypothetical protein